MTDAAQPKVFRILGGYISGCLLGALAALIYILAQENYAGVDYDYFDKAYIYILLCYIALVYCFVPFCALKILELLFITRTPKRKHMRVINSIIWAISGAFPIVSVSLPPGTGVFFVIWLAVSGATIGLVYDYIESGGRVGRAG